MFRRSATPGADVTVEVAGRALYAGYAVEAEVIVIPRRPLQVTTGWARLAQTELLRVDSARDAFPQMMQSRRRALPQPPEPKSVSYAFAENVSMEPGIEYRYPVQLRLPAAAPPTVKCKHAHITWELSAHIETRADWMPGGEGLLADLTQVRVGQCAQELVVFAHPSAAAVGGEELPAHPSAARQHRHVRMALELETGLVSNGGMVAGSLSVQPQASFGATELRVELMRWERSGNKQARVIEDREVLQRPATLVGGESTEWAFKLRVPERLMPSVLAQHSFVGWQVRAVIARRFRPDLNVTQLIQVYTSP